MADDSFGVKPPLDFKIYDLELPASQYDWPAALRRAYEVYLRKMDAAALQAIGDGYSVSQITVVENHQWEGNVYKFCGRVQCSGEPLNLGKRHLASAGARPPMIDGHPAFHWGGRIHNRARRGLADPARARWKLASSRRRFDLRHRRFYGTAT